MSSRPMALPSLSGLALRAHAPAHTGVGGEGRKRTREDVCATLRAQFAAVQKTLSDESGPKENIVSALTNALNGATNLLWDSDSDWDYEFNVCVLDVVMEYLGVVVDAAKGFSSTNSEEKTMSYEALKLLASVALHGNRAQVERLDTAGCVTLGIRALRQRAASEDFPLEETVHILASVARETTQWLEDMTNGIDVLWELLKDEDMSFGVRTDAIRILESIVEAGDEYNGKFRVYEHDNLEMWKLYTEVLDDTKRQAWFLEPTEPNGCNAVADILADPSKMRALLEAHPNVYDAIVRMREDAKSCWPFFEDQKKAAIDAMLGSRGYQTAAALSSHAPSLVAAIALAKTLRGEAEAAINDYLALIASPQLTLYTDDELIRKIETEQAKLKSMQAAGSSVQSGARQQLEDQVRAMNAELDRRREAARDLVAATVEQAAQRGELATLRKSIGECHDFLERVSVNEDQKWSKPDLVTIASDVHRAVEGVYKGYERVKDIPLLLHRLDMAHGPFRNDDSDPLGGVPKQLQELRQALQETERRVAEGPYTLHDMNQAARMQPRNTA